MRRSAAWDEAWERDGARSHGLTGHVDNFRFILTKGNGKSLKTSKLRKHIWFAFHKSRSGYCGCMLNVDRRQIFMNKG